VNPSGVTKDGFGNVPFARDEFTADRIDCHINLDLAQIRGYGLGEPVEKLIVLLALHRVRKLLDGDLRLRTACDLERVSDAAIVASRPAGFELPELETLEIALASFIGECRELMTHETVAFDAELKKGKDDKESDLPASDDNGED
jgi:CRISPR-associated protein Csb1